MDLNAKLYPVGISENVVIIHDKTYNTITECTRTRDFDFVR